jgi:hypothetical protein
MAEIKGITGELQYLSKAIGKIKDPEVKKKVANHMKELKETINDLKSELKMIGK